jgi:cyclophilin family peptidyl-prolyl cis-trans isomerase
LLAWLFFFGLFLLVFWVGLCDIRFLAGRIFSGFLILEKILFFGQNYNFTVGLFFPRFCGVLLTRGGYPRFTGGGGRAYRFPDEPVQRPYSRGTLAMANAGPNTNGSQFFIMHADYPLPPNYTIFGQLIEGEDVLDKIATAPTDPQDRPLKPVEIKSVRILESN